MMFRFFAALLGLMAPLSIVAAPLKAFPAAEPGFERFVFELPKQEDETEHKVEVLVGKMDQIDCNTHSYGGQLRRESLPGWGYSYFQLDQVSGPMSTRMACLGQAPREAFVPVIGDGFLIRYNSRLPVVVYVPQGFEVRYRVWSAGEIATAAARK